MWKVKGWDSNSINYMGCQINGEFVLLYFYLNLSIV